METTSTLQIGSIIIGLLGGLALFLYGMEQMTDALKIIAGGRMKNLLAQLTTNRFKGVFTGAFVTAIIQSSSVTTVLVVGFVSAGLLTLSQSIGIIMGAEIGTTITAQIIAFKVTKFALALVAIGFAVHFLSRTNKRRQYGLMIMGFGLIFFGMNQMSSATSPLRTYQPFIDLMGQLDNLFLAVLVGALFTALIQSSSASIGIVIVLAGQGFIPLETGIALTFGANIGTSITAVLASIGKPREAVQTAMVHVSFNTIGVILWFGFIGQLSDLVRLISPVSEGLTGAAKLAAETPRQIANAHTIFNVSNTLIFIWFTKPLEWLVRHIVPDRPSYGPAAIMPKYLDEHLLGTPEMALERVRLELERLGKYTLRMVRRALPTVMRGTEDELEQLARMDDTIDTLYQAILDYLRLLSREDMLHSQSQHLSEYMNIANDMENIGDMIETNLVEAGGERLEYNVKMSEATQEALKALHDKVCWAVEQAFEAMATSNKALAQKVRAAKPEVNRLADEADRHLSRRLAADEPNRLATFRVESDIIEYLKRVYYFAKRIARVTTQMDTAYMTDVMPTTEDAMFE